MSEEIDLLEDFRALVAALDAEGIDYAVVGALALAVHGFPRATRDIDLLVRKEHLPFCGWPRKSAIASPPSR